MSRPPLPEGATAMLIKANHAVIATVRADGQPVSTATWYLWDHGRVLVNMDEGRRRLDHLRNDPRVTLTVLDRDNWGTHLTLIGHVEEMHDDEELSDIDRLSRHYLGRPYPTRDRSRVSAWIEIDRWHGWGTFRDSGPSVPELDLRL
ncbi:PPOX class F420-dependent oxidoreductase [Streptomyces sp. GTA36]